VGKDFGAELRRMRMAAGMSLHDLSVEVHYSRGHLSKVENNVAVPSPALVRLADAAVHASGQLVGFLEKRMGPEQPPAGTGDETWTVVMDPESGTWFSTARQGQHIIQAIDAGGEFGAVPVSEVSPAQAELVLRTFRATFDETRAVGRLTDPRFLLPTLWTATHTLRQLAAAARPPVRLGALALAGRYAELAGWLAQEAGDDRAALWWTDLAVRLAEAAGDDVLGAYAHVRRALVALYRGDVAGTVEHARQAQARAGVSTTVQGIAALREAQGLALGGDDIECRRAIDRGAECLAQAEDGDPALPALGSTSLADPVAVTTGWCLYDLGRPAQAADVLGREVARIPAGSRRAHVRFAARQALAAAAASEVDRACELTSGLLAGARDLGSATIRQDLRQLARMFRRWPAHREVRSIQPGLDQLLRVPAVPARLKG
jgi:transcriptional regulator with XRE-family HTH domain